MAIETDPHTAQGTQTILFTDLEGSTDLRVRVGDSIANEVIGEHDRLVRSLLVGGGATDVKGLGDGFMALFSSANGAIDTAVSIQRAIANHNEANPERSISVRMGLNSGDVTHKDGDAHGTAVHAASRVAAKAQGGQILISQIVSHLAGSLGDAKVVDRGLFWLKGFPERWRLFEVLWRDGPASADRASREVREASAAAFDFAAPRSERPVVGRAEEQQAVRDQLGAAASGGLRAVVLEGEAGIGKTRMLEATIDFAQEADSRYRILNVSADEELRGPFLLFRSVLGSPRMATVAKDAMSLESLDRAQNAITGRSAGGTGLTPQEQMLHIFDEVTSMISALVREGPIALLFDDLQWADEDSIQLIRYLVRTLPSAPIFLLITIRPYSESTSSTKLIADLDRMRATRVLRLHRLSKHETAEFLEDLLGSPVDEQTLQSFHARSEGVPFFLEEFARAYREADALQLMDGTWTMTRLSGPAVPSSVQSLIERRLAQLSEECRGLLADAGVLGRRFRLSDLAPVLAEIRREPEKTEWDLAEDLRMAVQYGLLIEEPDGAAYDFTFTHDQIRASLLEDMPRRRKQAIHGAITSMLESREGDADLSMLAFHSMKAGNNEKAVATAISAAREALATAAPEEGIRLIDSALAAASDPADRMEMLRVKDDALAILDRGADRIANLAEMSALTGALPSSELESEVKLRRASASRSVEDYDSAAELAKEVRSLAVQLEDPQLELDACFELGQALTRSAIGEGYWPIIELSLEEPNEAYTKGLELARQLGSREDEAIALRELAVIEGGRIRQEAFKAEQSGASRLEILAMGPTLFAGAKELAEQAYKVFEEIGDQRGAMSALISMAYSHITDPTAHGMAGRIEHIRALHNSRRAQVTDSQRATEDAHMLYSIQTYARLNVQPELALLRGQETFEAARALGDKWLETLAAGGMALTYSSLGAAPDASAWLDRAASSAMAVPSNSMARRLEMWRGACAAARSEVDEMQKHFERAAELAGTKSAAGQAEAHCALAMELAKVGVLGNDPETLEQARASAIRTMESVATLPGNVPWSSVAHAVMALVAESEGRVEDAAEEARTALSSLDGLTHIHHFINVLWAAGRVLIGNDAPEGDGLKQQIAQGLGLLSMNMANPEIKTQWFAVESHRELAQLVGFEFTDQFDGGAPSTDLDDHELELLRAIASGSADDDGSKDGVESLLAKLGVDNELAAIEYAITAGITWQ